MRSRLVLLLTVLAACAAARTSTVWQLGLSYDDNLFELSPSDLDTFRSSANPARFPYRSADDADMLAAATLRLSDGGWHGSVRARLHLMYSNWEKSYGVFGVAGGRAVPVLGRVNLSYTYLPSYMIRYFRDPTPGTVARYVPCRFAEHLGGIELRRAFGPVEVAPRYRFEYDCYLRQFSYYDTRLHRADLGLRYEPLRNLSLDAGYELGLADAAGPVPDISYRQHRFSFAFAAWPQRHRQFGVEGGYEFARRYYTTQNRPEVDPGHAGRQDDMSTAEFGFRYRLGQVTLRARYQLEWREVFSPYEVSIDDVKDFRRSRFTLAAILAPGRSNPNEE